MTTDQLQIIIAEHAKWLTDPNTGARANLADADLIGVDLSGAART